MLFLYALFLRTVDTLRLRREEGQTTAEYALAILAAAAVAVVLDRLGPIFRQAAGVLRQRDRQRDRRCGRCLTDADRSAGPRPSSSPLVLPLVLVVTLALVQTGLLVRDRLLVEAAARGCARRRHPGRSVRHPNGRTRCRAVARRG